MRWKQVPVAILAAMAVAWSGRQLAAQRLPPVTLTRIYTGSDNQTHAEETDVKLPALAGRQETETVKAASSRFVRFPPGTVQDWHPASQRRYIVTLSGRGEIEVAGGKKTILEPGHVLQVEDLTGKGHVTRTLGNSDWVVLEVKFDQ